MDNKAKVYTLYFAIEDVIASICRIVNDRENSKKVKSDELFNRFWIKAKNKYSALNYDLVAEMGLTNSKAEEEFASIALAIKSYLGILETNSHCYLIYSLWFALNAVIVEHSLTDTSANQHDFYYEIRDRLNLGSQRYLSLSQANIEEWQLIDSIIKSKLGDF
jgi:hypothetical protein